MSSSRQHMLIRILQRLFSVNGALADVHAHAHLKITKLQDFGLEDAVSMIFRKNL